MTTKEIQTHERANEREHLKPKRRKKLTQEQRAVIDAILADMERSEP